MSDIERGRDGSKVLHAMREAILRLEMRPGSVLDEANLTAQLNVSRTPIREAIIQLIAEGLVIRDGRSARVAPLDFDEIPKLFDALLIASRMIHRLAAENRTVADMARIVATMKGFEADIGTGDGVRIQDANVQFHLAISAAARNDYFREFYERTLLASSRLALACFSRPERGKMQDVASHRDLSAHFAETVRQHRLICEAIEAKDVAGADAMAIRHKDLYLARLQKMLFTTSHAISDVASLDLQHRIA